MVEVSEDCQLEADGLAGYRCRSCGLTSSDCKGYVPSGWMTKLIRQDGLFSTGKAVILLCPKCAGKKR